MGSDALINEPFNSGGEKLIACRFKIQSFPLLRMFGTNYHVTHLKRRLETGGEM